MKTDIYPAGVVALQLLAEKDNPQRPQRHWGVEPGVSISFLVPWALDLDLGLRLRPKDLGP